MSRSHKDVEFHVDKATVRAEDRGATEVFDDFDKAAGHAVSMATSTGGAWHVDIVIYSRAGARWWSGDVGAEIYDEDPEASVFERIVVRADSKGRVP